MAPNDEDERQTERAAPEPAADMATLDRLVGTWALSGGVGGRTTYEWMEGGHFLIQRLDLDTEGRRTTGIEVIGHLRPFMGEPSADIVSRYYSGTGDTLDYVYEIEGDVFTIWAGERGSPAYSRGTFSADGRSCSGAWVFPGGGGYPWTMTRVDEADPAR